MTDLLFKYFRGEATDQEREQIGRWLDEHPEENAKTYKEARFMYEAAILYGDDTAYKQKQPSRKLTWRTVGRVAIGAAAAVLLAFGVGYLSRERTYDMLSQQTVVLETPIGQRAEMVLPDGSHVWLNAATRIEYPSVFARHERRIRLSGEAMFEVMPDAANPFIVETFASEIEVLGTRFDVLAEAENNRFSTTLLRGKVKVSNRADVQNVIVMSPNEVVTLENGSLRIDSSSDLNAMCWLDGQVSFGKLPFDVLMKTFHFNMLRSVLEKTATFFGYDDFSKCVYGIEDEVLYARALNLLSHGGFSIYEPVDMGDDTKDLFIKVFDAFISKYDFQLPEILIEQENN